MVILRVPSVCTVIFRYPAPATPNSAKSRYQPGDFWRVGGDGSPRTVPHLTPAVCHCYAVGGAKQVIGGSHDRIFIARPGGTPWFGTGAHAQPTGAPSRAQPRVGRTT